MIKLKIKDSNSELILSDGTSTDWLSSFIADNSLCHSRYFIISDDQVFPLFGNMLTEALSLKSIPFHTILFPGKEQSKTLLSAQRCWEEMACFGLDRRSCVIALGGGVISDLAGFAASCYMRGIDYFSIPTTLIGMADAAIGGKTAVNLNEGKNLIGTFHQPLRTLICPSFLQTLPDKEFFSGLAEVIKCAVIRDPLLFEYLENHLEQIMNKESKSMQWIIQRACEIKIEIVEKDPHDQRGERALLNWGHTFAHAIEASTGYRLYLHGEAVAIGMHCAALISEKLGYASEEFTMRQKKLLERARLPVTLPRLPLGRLLELMSKDKKAENGKISLIVAEKIGKVFKVRHIDKQLIQESLIQVMAP